MERKNVHKKIETFTQFLGTPEGQFKRVFDNIEDPDTRK